LALQPGHSSPLLFLLLFQLVHSTDATTKKIFPLLHFIAHLRNSIFYLPAADGYFHALTPDFTGIFGLFVNMNTLATDFNEHHAAVHT